MYDADLVWLAGWLEGEGCFMAGPPSSPRSTRIIAVTTDLDVARHAARIMRASVGQRPKERRHHKDQYVVTRAGEPARKLMRSLRPLMGVRRQEAIDAALASYEPPSKRGVLTHTEANEIRALYAAGVKPKQIMEHFQRNRNKIISRDVVRNARRSLSA